ncbi:GGDEF domain-containing protein [Paraglaciecola sp.]|uniref:GGDEF domain-containing protein n=1 Tax=Paraglaciecola sp. TaxID=1920173 RepID=UPI003EF529BA
MKLRFLGYRLKIIWLSLVVIFSLFSHHTYAKDSLPYLTSFELPYSTYLRDMQSSPDSVLNQLIDNPPNATSSNIVKAQYFATLGQAYYSLTYPQKSLEQASKALSFVSVETEPWLAHNLRIFEALSLEMAGQHDRGLEGTNAAIKWAEKHDNRQTLLLGLYTRGTLHNSLTNYSLALADFQRAYSLATDDHGTISRADIAGMQAQVYEYRQEAALAIPLFEEAEKAYRENQAWGELSIILYGLGRANRDIGKQELGQSQLEESLSLAKQINDQQGVAYALKDLAKISIALGHFDKANQQLNQAAEILSTANNAHLQFDVLVTLSKLNLRQGKLEHAKEYLLQASGYLDRESMPIHAIQYDEYNAKLLFEQGALTQAYELIRSSYSAYKTYSNTESSEQLHRLRVQSELESSNRQNLILSHKNELQTLELKNHRSDSLKMFVIICLSFGACVLLGVILYRGTLYNRTLKSLVNTDELTGLANRRFILEKLKVQLKFSQSNKADLCVAMIDLDWFKQINDQYGHFTGDKVLKEFARICAATIGKTDIIGRIGGEEFLLVMPNVNCQNAKIELENLRLKIANLADNINLPETKVTISVGVSSSLATDTLEDLIQRADSALYQAKETGRNRVVVCDNQ